MQAELSPTRQARAQSRHELRSLTCVTFDDANGGIVRDLSQEGMAVQAVAELRPGQQLQICFELRRPRLRVETRGEVIWATQAGRCGIRFLEVPPRLTRQINEWIDKSARAASHPDPSGSLFGESEGSADLLADANENESAAASDGLMVSSGAVNMIEMPRMAEAHGPEQAIDEEELSSRPATELDWLSQPFSGRGLAWIVNVLVVLAALLLFALIFLSVASEPPQHPLIMIAGVTVLMAGLYWGFFKVFGGGSPGAILARMIDAGIPEDESGQDDRFR